MVMRELSAALIARPEAAFSILAAAYVKKTSV